MKTIRTYMNELEDEKARLADLVNTHGITPEMVIESLTPAERKIVDILGGESMIYGLVNGAVNEYGKLEEHEQHGEPEQVHES